MTDTTALLRDLARVKVEFQLRTLELVLGIPSQPRIGPKRGQG